MSTQRLRGIIPPIITPLLPDRRIDTLALRGLIRSMIAGGVSGIFAMGTAGESPTLTRSQREEALAVMREECAGKILLLVGLMEASTDRTLELLPEAEELSADAVVVTTPYYYKVKQAEVIRHVAAVRESTELPIVLYNIPVFTVNAMEPSTVRELAGYPDVIGYKDSSGSIADLQQVLRLTADLPDFSVMQGSQKLSLASLLVGAHGLVPGLGNVMPAHFVRLFAAVRENRLQEAHVLQDQITRMEDALFMEGYTLTVMKNMVGALGYGQGIPHYPLPMMSGSGLDKLKALLVSEGILTGQSV